MSTVDKDRILALIKEGADRRENRPAPPPIVKAKPEMPSLPAPPQESPLPMEVLPDEPPPESPNALDSSSGLPRRRRVGLRSDPAWMQKTVYLRRATVTEAEKVAVAMGVEFSELMEWALSLQVQDETRSPNLAAILERMKR